MIGLRPGDTVYDGEGNELRLGPAIGGGAFGIVYEVKPRDGITLALKTINMSILETLEVQALLNEGKLVTEIRDENVLKVIFFHDGQKYPELPPYMLMEKADGGTLADLIRNAKALKSFFGLHELRGMYIQLAKGMKAVSAKLVHRDIKPDNILIHRDVLKIADFGLSKFVGAATRTLTFKEMQHIRYRSPEAWKLLPNTPAMDIYSMGIVFYELATLKHPYTVSEDTDPFEAWKEAHLTKTADDPRTINPGLDLTISRLLLKMISKRPGERYKTWDEILEKLTQPETGKTELIDVTRLLERAFQSKRNEEAARLAAHVRTKQETETRSLIDFSFGDIVRAAKTIVEAFNAKSEDIKLVVSDISNRTFKIKRLGHVGGRSIDCNIARPHESCQLDAKPILAWGIIEGPENRGFNIILISDERTSPYGQWLSLHVAQSPLASHSPRPEPFAFKFAELPKEIRLLSAMHIYQTAKASFSPDMLIPLIEELF